MSGYIGTQPVPQATQTRDSFTCTAGQTSFATSGFTPNFLDVYLNGVKLTATDYTASNGSDVVLASGAATGDVLEVVAFTTFDVVTDTITAAGTALTLDRTGSDGTILDLKKDGSTVGSIGVDYSTEFFVGGGGSGFYLNTAAIRPTTGGAASTLTDGTIDFGYPSARWKDLYLSGGVFLGGTGSANKLDDVETGTCTITIKDSSNNSATMVVNVFTYVKIGSLVHLTGTLQWSSTSALDTSRIQIHGLPFASASSASGGAYRSPVSNGTSTSGSFTIPREEIAFGIDPNATFIWGSQVTGNNVDGGLTKSHLGTSGILYSLQAIYETDA